MRRSSVDQRRSSVDAGHLDRYIPRRRGSNIDLSHLKLLNLSGSAQDNVDSPGPPSADAIPSTPFFQTPGSDNNSILNISPQVDFETGDPASAFMTPTRKTNRKLPSSPERYFAIPRPVEDIYVHPFDWGVKGDIVISQRECVYSWNYADKPTDSVTVPIHDIIGTNVTSYVTSVAWSPDGQYLALGSDTGYVMMLDFVNDISGVISDEGICQCTYSIDLLAWSSRGSDSVLYCAQSCGCLREFVLQFKRVGNTIFKVLSDSIRTSISPMRICGLKISPLNVFLAFGDNNGKIYIWSTKTESSEPEIVIQDHSLQVMALSFCPWQPTLLASSSGNSTDCATVKGHKVTNGFKMFDIDSPSEIRCLVWSRQTREMISAHGLPETTGTIRIWSYPSMDLVGCLQTGQGQIFYLALSPDGCTLASVSSEAMLHLWIIAKKKKKAEALPRRMSLQLSSPISASPLSACIR